MIRYKAKIYKDSNGFSVDVPDLVGCYSFAKNLIEAQLSAVEALDLYLQEANDPIWPLPKAKNHQGDKYFWIYARPEVSIPLMIREARKRRRLTQKQASELLDMKLQTYQKLEYIGKSNPTAMTLIRIAEAFDTKFELSA